MGRCNPINWENVVHTINYIKNTLMHFCKMNGGNNCFIPISLFIKKYVCIFAYR